MNQLTVTCPIPPRALHPNARPHWAAKAKAAKQARHDAMCCALEATGNHRPNWPAAVCHIRWYARDKRGLALDRDNIIAATKAARDGLTDAGIWTDDNGVRIGEVTIEVDRASPRVELVVERADEPTMPRKARQIPRVASEPPPASIPTCTNREGAV